MPDTQTDCDIRWSYVDLHSHLLPGVDDGCLTLDDSLQVASRAVEWGCRQLWCTPHMGLIRYPDNTPTIVARRVEQLQRELDERGVELRIGAAGEFRLTGESIAWWERHGVPTLGNSRVVLVDTWATEWEPSFDRALDWLQQRDYEPLLAHPERMRIESESWVPLIERLLRRGIRLQGNFKSFGDADRPEVRERAWLLIGNRAYDVLAGDLHGPASLMARAIGMAELERRVEPERLRRLVLERPIEIVEGGGTLPNGEHLAAGEDARR
ncbi:MAG TPA: hypothetical protein DCQ98_04620 [Planctomycetaceae bacterium]|nr:hypothetical protein [Planctomycetaceae bacterium]HRF01659.1 hypothetical protein [Pirellulaceae bacterium]